MPYEADDPRSRLASAAPTGGSSSFGVATYARFYATEPEETQTHAQTWFARGQNFVIAYSRAEAGAKFERKGQVDEYVLLLNDRASSAIVTANGETKAIEGYSVTFVPPGDSTVEITGGGEVVRLFTTQSADLVAKVSNPDKYIGAHPHVPEFKAWPDPVGGFKIRTYSLDVPDAPGRFGKIWRCTTFMVNYLPTKGARDLNKLSPHHHDDFEQGSLALDGSYIHHLRWPWTAKLSDWRADEHEECAAPSICVIPPRVVHTSACTESMNVLVDVFSPPRTDFSNMEGWVLNADEYPMPAN